MSIAYQIVVCAGMVPDSLETLWKKCVFGLGGVRNVTQRTFSVVVTSTPDQRARWLAEVRETVSARFSAAAN